MKTFIKKLKLFENSYLSISGQQIAYSILLMVFIFFMTVLIYSEGYYGGADSLVHYMYSRYSWQFPSFLLDHWAKPIFTLFTLPFAQFGHAGVSVFNVITGIISAFLCYKIVEKLNYKFTWSVIVILCFIPIYNVVMLSGLTEIFFGFLIIWAIYLCLFEYYFAAAIVASFMPIARTEGIIILPIIAFYLLLAKKYRELPLLFTGTILYSIIGYFKYKDIFWLITQMPYRGATDIYGTGSLLHFVEDSPLYFNGAIVILIVFGLVYLSINLIKSPKTYFRQVLLIAFPFLAYFVAHSVMWWSGIGNSLGLHRYMAAIAPLGAILSLQGLNLIFNIIRNKIIFKKIYYVFFAILLIVIIQRPIKQYRLPLKLSGADKLMKEASDYIIENDLLKNKIYYYDPAFFYFLDMNPFDEKQCKSHVYNPEKPEQGIDNGSIVIWDAHFSPILKLEKTTMLNSRYYKLLKVFKPEYDLKIFDRDYEVLVFQRVGQFSTIVNKEIYSKKHMVGNYSKQLYFQNFEAEYTDENNSIVQLNDSNKVFRLDSTMEFVSTYSITDKIEEKNVYCEIEIFIEDSIVDKCPHLVIEKRHRGKLEEYFTSNNITQSDSVKSKINLVANFKKSMRKNDEIRIYVWNSSKIKCYLDDFYIGIK